MTFQVATTAFYVPGNLATALNTFYTRGGGNADSFVFGLRVQTSHVRPGTGTVAPTPLTLSLKLGYRKTIRRVGKKSAKDEMFNHEKWGQISVQEYFKRNRVWNDLLRIGLQTKSH